MRRTGLVTVALVVVLGVGGCAKKSPAAAPAASPPAAPPPAGPLTPPPQPPLAPPIPVPDHDPLDAADLDAVNAYVRRAGLLGDVYFDYDRAELGETARGQLERNAAFLGSRPEFAVAIEGHCDERGSAEYNLALGERRASAAHAYLGRLGLETGRLQTVSYGKERPVCTSSDGGCWKQNRRAGFVIVARRGPS